MTNENTAAHAVQRMAFDMPLMRGPTGDRLVTAPLLPLMGINFNRNHLRKLWTRGEFPKPLKLSPRKLAWRERELLAWLASRGVGPAATPARQTGVCASCGQELRPTGW